ncbi:OapA family protein [Sansalvadorimonas verongulae]|uniref:OapA family protein n=1 Tax=Sansalvadorimonas verongulae TaxID=2172824 RepID=UPI0012BC8F39|nr:peptidoglycan DD-metalloendopeptidase family protein [Sansalvadorimonas verongulae]MTI13181.1 peptidase M23 [Sansalvadorimonas verongulae]
MNILLRALQTAAKNFPTRHALVLAAASSCIALSLVFIPGKDAQAKRTEIPSSLSDADTASLKDAEKILSSAGEVPDSSVAPNAIVPDVAGKPAQTSGKDYTDTNLHHPVIAWERTKVRAGDTLSAIFSRERLSAGTLQRILRTSEHGNTLADIRPGQAIVFGRVNGELQGLKYVRNRLESIEFTRTDNGFISEEVVRTPEIRLAHSTATIRNSLFHAGAKAGLSDNMTMRLANIFAWDIDFVQGIRDGDTFNLVFEEKYLDGEKIGYGNILAATFTNRGTTHKAIYYTDSKGNSDYYTPDGKSMRKSFIRTPVEFTRISSRFNLNRVHPLFKTKRPHRGVDYAAPTGTPIKASGDGIIKLAGRQKGYGNVVYIQHPNNIVTVYAHQSRIAKGIRKGVRVKQGQTIGYVGMTGWATGPHLHYEFRINGTHRNPLTVKLPDATPLAKAEMSAFKRQTQIMLAELEQKSGTLLASAEENSNVTTQ